jgi:hypothetical protein
MHLTLNSRVTDLLKMLTYYRVCWEQRLFRRPVLVGHIKFLESVANSRCLAGRLSVIYYF